MSDLQKLINKLPENVRPIAELYAGFFADQTAESLLRISDMLIDGQGETAMKEILYSLSTDQLIGTLTRINDRLGEVTDAAIRSRAFQHEIIREAIAVGINVLIAKADLSKGDA